jgi:NAD(P)-dependent dehydrogenase (short-subunit alcohol dehydrogenase family)
METKLFHRNGSQRLCKQDSQLKSSKIQTHESNSQHYPETALIVGVGPGFGHAAARKLAASGMRVAIASRNAESLDPLVDELNSTGECTVKAYGCDATNESSVKKLISLVTKELGVPNLVVYSVQDFCPGRTVDIESPAFESCWRQNCFGGFVVAREAARAMLPLNRGTIVLIGSPSGLVGRIGHLNLAVGKFGLRALAQVMSRELSPNGVHVVHLVIDGEIKEDDSLPDAVPQANPEHVCEVVLSLHRQPKTAWTSEIDVRPWNEKFWERC